MNVRLYTRVLLFVFCLGNLTPLSAQTIRYVTPTGANSKDGSNWLNASDNLQAMIDASSADDQIWVAMGTYKPSSYPTGCSGCSTNKDYAFSLKDGVKIYGGFVEGTTDFALRNPKTNVSTLNGDLNGDGTINTYHVIITVSDGAGTVLDGFTIRGGKANVPSTITVETLNISREGGGGLIGMNSSPTLNNCLFTVNEGTSGGGLNLSSNSTPSFSTCMFYKNVSGTDGGAGVIRSSNPTFDRCVFDQNSSSSVGGAFTVYNASPVFTKSVFF